MRIREVIVMAVVATLAGTSCGPPLPSADAATEVSDSETRAAVPATIDARRALATEIPSWLEKTGVPAAGIAVIEDGEVVWTQTFGHRGHGEPADARTVFNLASLTKPVFAVMALHQIARGAVGLDQAISEYFVDDSFAEDRRQALLTPRLVLSHQTGLPNWRSQREVRFFADPGQRFGYSGEAYEYLSRALGEKLQRSGPDLVWAGIFERVGLSDSFLGWQDGVEGRFAFGFEEPPSGESTPEVVEPWMQEARYSSNYAAAGMSATVEDYARFAAWVSRGADLPPDMMRQMTTSQVSLGPGVDWGLGWVVLDLDDDTILHHGGGEEGASTFVALSTAHRYGLVVLTSASYGDLLIGPIVERLLPRGAEINWRLALQEMYSLESYWRRIEVTALPPEERDEHFFGIGGNPNRLPVLLLTTKTFSIARSGLSGDEKASAQGALDALMDRLTDGALTPEQIDSFSALIATPHPAGGFWYVRTDLSDDELRRVVALALEP